MTINDSRLIHVINEIDNTNQQDPTVEVVDGQNFAKEYLYSLRMTETLQKYIATPKATLEIAARGQHIKRWAIPRSDFPMDRKGYLLWRTKAKQMHSEILGELMQKHGYESSEIQEVSELILKKGLKSNPDVQVLEDVICLVFLKHYFKAFAKGHEEEKVVSILRKTWGKMSEKGHEAALTIPFDEEESKYIHAALNAE